jgi:hypothetical protein
MDMLGNLHATGFRRVDPWTHRNPSHYYAERFDGKTSKTYKWDQYHLIYNFFEDRRINVIWINQHTIPKYDPQSLSLSMDQPGTHTEVIQPLVQNQYLVLRAEYAGENEYEIVVITRKYNIKKFHAVVTGNIIGLGKSKSGSKRALVNKVVKATTAALTPL